MQVLSKLRRWSSPSDTNIVNGISLPPKTWAQVTILMKKYRVNRSRLVDIALHCLFEHLANEIAELEAGTANLDPAIVKFHQNAEVLAARLVEITATRQAAEAEARARDFAKKVADSGVRIDSDAAIAAAEAEADADLAAWHRTMAENS